ncbi:SMI1/KNR4 family protein [Pseudomonas sp. ABY48]|uniref:SMI1/KNR4 family protein n=1 Tax=Pseudomonas sp. ABY48 TaxID=3402865 RepID=UPI003B42B3C3
MIEIIESGNSISDDAMKLLESFIGVTLPREYYQFLSRNGGGYPEPDSFRFMDNEEGSSIQRFYGLNRSDTYDFVRNLNLYRGRIPEGFIAIACDPGGNQICLGIKGEVRGKVYFWDHELEKCDGTEPDDSNMTLVSSNFSDFLNGLYELDL